MNKNISLAFFYWVGIALHPGPFVYDIAMFVLKRDVKLQLTNYLGLAVKSLQVHIHDPEPVEHTCLCH